MSTSSGTRFTSRREFRRSLHRLTGPKRRVVIELRTVADAMADPGIAPYASWLLLVCTESAATGGKQACTGCCRRWTYDFGVNGIGFILTIGRKSACSVVALCRDCMAAPNTVELVRVGLERDLGLTDPIETLSPGGRA